MNSKTDSDQYTQFNNVLVIKMHINSKSTEIFMDQSDVSVRKLSISKCKHDHEPFNFTTKNNKNIDCSKEGSDCDYAAVSSQENRQQISPRSNRHVYLP